MSRTRTGRLKRFRNFSLVAAKSILTSMKKTVKMAAIAVAVIVLVFVAFYVLLLMNAVTPEKAQKESQKHFDDVKAKIMAVPDYKITKEGTPTANAIQDEVGSKDYDLSAEFLVQASSAVSAGGDMKTDIQKFVDKLASNDYGIVAENAPKADGQPARLCVYASRYLNDDGSYIPQGSTANRAKYVTQEEFDKGYVSPCADLLK